MYVSPAWCSCVIWTEKQQLDDVQKRAWCVLLVPAYTNHKDALTTLSLPKLSTSHRGVPSESVPRVDAQSSRMQTRGLGDLSAPRAHVVPVYRGGHQTSITVM